VTLGCKGGGSKKQRARKAHYHEIRLRDFRSSGAGSFDSFLEKKSSLLTGLKEGHGSTRVSAEQGRRFVRNTLV